MELAEAVRILKDNEADLKQMGVKSLYLFGSTVRGDQHPESDVDLFFDYDPATLGLFQLMDIKERASQLLGCHADIMTRTSISRHIRPQVEAEAIVIFSDA